MLHNNIILSAGGYDGTLHVYLIQDNGSSMKQLYSFRCHSSIIKTLASTNEYLCTGSTDETIQLFNLETGQSIGSLLNSFGSVNCLCLHYPSHLLSATDNGSVCIWRTTDWECLRILKGHKGAVTLVDVHSSGRMCISCGKDRTIRLWDLMRGTCAMTLVVHEVPIGLEWSADGSYYAILYPFRLTVVRSGSEDSRSIDLDSNSSVHFTALSFSMNGYVITGQSDGTLIGYSLLEEVSSGEIEWSLRKRYVFQGEHTNRIKGIAVVGSQVIDNDAHLIIVSGDTDGNLHLWNVTLSLAASNVAEEQPISPYMTVKSSLHLTCLTTNYLKHPLPTPTKLTLSQSTPIRQQSVTSFDKANRDVLTIKKKKGRFHLSLLDKKEHSPFRDTHTLVQNTNKRKLWKRIVPLFRKGRKLNSLCSFYDKNH